MRRRPSHVYDRTRTGLLLYRKRENMGDPKPSAETSFRTLVAVSGIFMMSTYVLLYAGKRSPAIRTTCAKKKTRPFNSASRWCLLPSPPEAGPLSHRLRGSTSVPGVHILPGDLCARTWDFFPTKTVMRCVPLTP